MTGSIQEKNGKLYAVLSYKDTDGNPKRKWVSTGLNIRGNKKKAEAMLPDIIEANTELEVKESGQILFVDYVRSWLLHKKPSVQQSTYEGYELYATRHIIPYFEPLGLTIDQVTPKHILDYYEDRMKSPRLDHKVGGLKPVSIKKHAIVMSQVFEAAMIEELAHRNPVAMVHIPKQEQEEKVGTFLTAEEANRLLKAFAGHELQALVYITLYYGLRRSEVLGLKWDAIDFENNMLRIRHTVVKQRTIIAKDSTKSTASRREYPLLPEIKDVLLQLWEKKKKDRIAFGSAYEESDYIFVWSDGKPYRPDYVTRAFRKVLEKNNFPHMRFHDIRHSTASILYDKGWELKDIQEWLGHADISTTGNIYTHISKQRKETIGKDLGNTFSL